MIRVKEWQRSSSLDDAVAGLGRVINQQYQGWTRGADVVITKKRVQNGQTLYEAYAWLTRAES